MCCIIRSCTLIRPINVVGDLGTWSGLQAVLVAFSLTAGLLVLLPLFTNCSSELKMPPATALRIQDDHLKPNPAAATALSVSDMPIVFVMGGPGSGKGTQCSLIKERFGFTHLSTGDLLRDDVNSGSPRGAWLNEIMVRGDLVPLETVLNLLKEAIVRQAATSKGFLIDGFPREVAQASEFEKQVGTCSMVIYFEVPFDIMAERLLVRGITSGRSDDNIETIKKRLQTFADQTIPVVEHYKAINKTFVIRADRDIDAVFADVTSVLTVAKV